MGKKIKSDELIIANQHLAIQLKEKEKLSEELMLINFELASQTSENELLEAKLIAINQKLAIHSEKEQLSKAVNIPNFARKLIEASLDPLFTISTTGKITDANQASLTVTTLTREELIGTNFSQYFTEPDKASEGYQRIFKMGFVKDYPLTIIDGELTPVLFNGSVYKDNKGTVIGAVVVARFITEQKRFEKELTEAKIDAEKATKIAEDAKNKAENATSNAEHAAHIAEVAVKAKQQFLSNMSHEIRTPMNAIIGFTKVILKTELTAKQTEYLTAIKMSGDALIVLINDILDLAKVDSGKMVFEQTPFKLESSISSMLQLFETKIQEKNLKLIKVYDSTIPEVLLGDSVRLNQIVLNLLSNAVKFTHQGEITVGVKIKKEDEKNVIIEFSVSDTGIGIPKNKLKKIFENFQQATSGTSRLYGGTGLGLAIVKQLVEAQGGKITVNSVVNKGSTFSFELDFPKSEMTIESITHTTEFDNEIKNIKVLVVEDIAINQLLMKTLLDDYGFDRDFASNGKIATEMLQYKLYDIILMDLQMPVMNGFEATEYIRNELHSKIPIIALTADVTTVDLDKCKSVGMNDYLAKPVDEKLLYTKIVTLVKKQNVKIIKEVITDLNTKVKPTKCVNLNYLSERTKSDPVLMMEMISLYLEQTPQLIRSMKQSLNDQDWNQLSGSIHKMIPSFSIMGIGEEYETMAKKIQDYSNLKLKSEEIHDYVFQLENICLQACSELEEEYNIIKQRINA